MSELIIEPIEQYGLHITTQRKNKPLFSKIGVVGAGKEGRNIINLTASAGMEVVFMEESEERIKYVMDQLSKNMDTRIENWGLTQSEKKAIMNRITPTLV
jgi:3-hydroxybutyryl-CoA dehydrogenase